LNIHFLELIFILIQRLGDLSRYRNDLEISNSVITAERFYHQVTIIVSCYKMYMILYFIDLFRQFWSIQVLVSLITNLGL
jgi:hypothetical protein